MGKGKGSPEGFVAPVTPARIAVTRYMQRQGQIWIRIFPDKPITRKPADVRREILCGYFTDRTVCGIG